VLSPGVSEDGKGEVEDDEIELWDKLAALDRLGKHLGLFSEAEALKDAAHETLKPT
jgi:hypothetical protein